MNHFIIILIIEFLFFSFENSEVVFLEKIGNKYELKSKNNSIIIYWNNAITDSNINKEKLKLFSNIDYKKLWDNTFQFYDHKNILKYLKHEKYIDAIKCGFKFYSSKVDYLSHDQFQIFLGSLPNEIKKKMILTSFDFFESEYANENTRTSISYVKLRYTMGNIGFYYKNGKRFEFKTNTYVSKGKQSRWAQNYPDILFLDNIFNLEDEDIVLCMPDDMKTHFNEYIYRNLNQYLKNFNKAHKPIFFSDVVYQLNEEGMTHFPDYYINFGNKTVIKTFYENGLGNSFRTCPYFLFGFGFLKKFDYVEFDYENNKLNLYIYENNSKINISNYEEIKENETNAKTFGLFNSKFEVGILLLIFIFYIYISTLRKNKKKNNSKVFEEYFNLEKK